MVTRQITKKKKKKTSTPPCIHSVFIIFIYKQLPWISHRLINKRWTGDGRWCLSNRNRFSPVISPHVCVTSLKLKPKHRWPLLETNSSHSLWHSETLPFVKWCDAMILPNALGMRSYKQWSETVKTRYIYSLTSSWKLKKNSSTFKRIFLISFRFTKQRWKKNKHILPPSYCEPPDKGTFSLTEHSLRFQKLSRGYSPNWCIHNIGD